MKFFKYIFKHISKTFSKLRIDFFITYLNQTMNSSFVTYKVVDDNQNVVFTVDIKEYLRICIALEDAENALKICNDIEKAKQNYNSECKINKTSEAKSEDDLTFRLRKTEEELCLKNDELKELQVKYFKLEKEKKQLEKNFDKIDHKLKIYESKIEELKNIN